MGFRDFELDVHSDSKYGYGCGSLYVTHGFTAVNNWDLRKGFEVVAKYGFLNRKTPIVISIQREFNSIKHLKYFVNALKILTNAGIEILNSSKISE